MEALYAISPIVVSLAICGLLILGEHRRAAAREEAANAARALNLSFHDDPKGTPVLRGNVEGRRVIAEVGRRSLRVQVQGLPKVGRLTFTAKRSNPSRERHRPPHLRDVEVGDAELDDRWTLEGREEGLVRALFSRVEVQRYLEIWRELKLHPDGKLEVERFTEPGPDVSDEIRRALELMSLLEALADIEPVEAPRAVEALLEASGIGGASGMPVSVPSLGPPSQGGER